MRLKSSRLLLWPLALALLALWPSSIFGLTPEERTQLQAICAKLDARCVRLASLSTDLQWALQETQRSLEESEASYQEAQSQISELETRLAEREASARESALRLQDLEPILQSSADTLRRTEAELFWWRLAAVAGGALAAGAMIWGASR